MLWAGLTGSEASLIRLVRVNKTFYGIFTGDLFWSRFINSEFYRNPEVSLSDVPISDSFYSECVRKKIKIKCLWGGGENLLNNTVVIGYPIQYGFRKQWMDLYLDTLKILDRQKKFTAQMNNLADGYFTTFLTGEVLRSSLKGKKPIYELTKRRSCVQYINPNAVDVFKMASLGARDLRNVIVNRLPVPEGWWTYNPLLDHLLMRDAHDKAVYNEYEPIEQLQSSSFWYIKQPKNHSFFEYSRSDVTYE